MSNTDWKLLFRPQTYQQDSVIIGRTRHRLYLQEDKDNTLIYNEIGLLHNILKHYYNDECVISEALRPNQTHLAKELLVNWSPVSIPSRLDEFADLLKGTHDDDSPKRLQDMLTHVYTTLDNRVIDVFMGRFFRHIVDSYYIPFQGILPEDEENILDTHEIYPWIWILPHFQQANREHSLDIPQNLKGNGHQQN